jgi:uncharacterized protein GlcG (DUF336 family)
MIIKYGIDASMAARAIDAAAAYATGAGLRMCIAIADESGDLKAFLRMDGAPKLSLQIAQDKAFTAACFGLATHGWYDFIKNDPPLLHGVGSIPRLVIFGGGFPVVVDEGMIGAIGVSGGHYTQDMDCARAGLAAIGARVE